jgi:hypothetical protein
VVVPARFRPFSKPFLSYLATQLDVDILAADGDTYYSVEVQLGEVDASHSFRVFDYWARNRLRFEGKTHVAVLVVEAPLADTDRHSKPSLSISP